MPRFVDLSHVVRTGMTTYKGLPGPVITDYLTREASRPHYTGDTEFQIGRIDMVANTGSYVDCPSHRFADGKDLATMPLERFVGLPAVVVRVDHRERIRIDRDDLAPVDVAGHAVLVATGWSVHWGSERYQHDNPFLTREAALDLRDRGALLVGIDSHNIDDTRTPNDRPAHTILLGAEIPVVEHLRGLDLLPDDGFRFTAVPPKIEGMGTFPVRAFAEIPD